MKQLFYGKCIAFAFLIISSVVNYSNAQAERWESQSKAFQKIGQYCQKRSRFVSENTNRLHSFIRQHTYKMSKHGFNEYIDARLGRRILDHTGYWVRQMNDKLYSTARSPDKSFERRQQLCKDISFSINQLIVGIHQELQPGNFDPNYDQYRFATDPSSRAHQYIKNLDLSHGADINVVPSYVYNILHGQKR